MQKQDRFTYTVKATENITVAITPSVNLGKLYTASLNGNGLPKPADGVYRFAATKPEAVLMIAFRFLGAPEGARYFLSIDGDSTDNAGPFKVFVNNGDPLTDKEFEFIVAK